MQALKVTISNPLLSGSEDELAEILAANQESGVSSGISSTSSKSTPAVVIMGGTAEVDDNEYPFNDVEILLMGS